MSSAFHNHGLYFLPQKHKIKENYLPQDSLLQCHLDPVTLRLTSRPQRPPLHTPPDPAEPGLGWPHSRHSPKPCKGPLYTGSPYQADLTHVRSLPPSLPDNHEGPNTTLGGDAGPRHKDQSLTSVTFQWIHCSASVCLCPALHGDQPTTWSRTALSSISTNRHITKFSSCLIKRDQKKKIKFILIYFI